MGINEKLSFLVNSVAAAVALTAADSNPVTTLKRGEKSMKNSTARRVLLGTAVLAALGAGGAATNADQISLLGTGTHSFTSNQGTIFSLTDIQPAGSGVFDPFVRIQRDNSEQGYNVAPKMGFEATTMDDKAPSQPNDVNGVIPINTVVDTNHTINLALDYNEPGGNKAGIDLLNLVLVVSSNSLKNGPAPNGSQDNPFVVGSIPADAGDVTLYTMSTDTTPPNPFSIHMDATDNLANGNGGSGQADLLVQVQVDPTLLHGIFDSNHYLYVYSLFGGTDGAGLLNGASEAGYEEWNIQKSTSPCTDCNNTGGGVPEPASLSILGVGAMSLMLRRRNSAKTRA
jgi:hypothetical protein